MLGVCWGVGTAVRVWGSPRRRGVFCASGRRRGAGCREACPGAWGPGSTASGPSPASPSTPWPAGALAGPFPKLSGHLLCFCVGPRPDRPPSAPAILIPSCLATPSITAPWWAGVQGPPNTRPQGHCPAREPGCLGAGGISEQGGADRETGRGGQNLSGRRAKPGVLPRGLLCPRPPQSRALSPDPRPRTLMPSPGPSPSPLRPSGSPAVPWPRRQACPRGLPGLRPSPAPTRHARAVSSDPEPPWEVGGRRCPQAPGQASWRPPLQDAHLARRGEAERTPPTGLGPQSEP